MKVPSLYLDTSVIGGYFDAEWMADTRELWTQAGAGRWRLLTSIVAEREEQNAPEEVREHFAASFEAANILDTSDEIERLAQAYLAAGVVTPKFLDDALHVAMASVHGIRLIVSWNFKHLVNVRREDGFNAVNLLEGWPPIRIVSPRACRELFLRKGLYFVNTKMQQAWDGEENDPENTLLSDRCE
jgi:predicted nucleic acid-binding protein